MLDFLDSFNQTIFVLFSLAYFYQFIYVFVVLWRKEQPRPEAKQNHRFAVVISARNESAVIGQLIESIKLQRYPKECLDIFVVADNCTDNTAQICRTAGAIVYERLNTKQVGKGYALDYIFKIILNNHQDKNYEAFLVLDADNLLDENYVAEMNKVFDSGYRIITSYRNSKNYDSNWISAGYSLWFLRESRYLNGARMRLGTSCAISGTGFMVHSKIIHKNNGWKHHLLTEDVEFTIDNVIDGETIGFCSTAVLYDEQPNTFVQSWHQRMRWAKGFYQVFYHYSLSLVKSIFKKGSFASFDMLMTISPALLISILSVGINGSVLMYAIFNKNIAISVILAAGAAVLYAALNFYTVFFVFGLLTTLTEWRQIHCSPSRKIFYAFTFPLFMFTYVPIAIVALFQKVAWVPIPHSIAKSIKEVRK
jgi:cellulose synthase/poly-beta-1,6-N-acetylglucosamine synthase-like glycosyltransferase